MTRRGLGEKKYRLPPFHGSEKKRHGVHTEKVVFAREGRCIAPSPTITRGRGRNILLEKKGGRSPRLVVKIGFKRDSTKKGGKKRRVPVGGYRLNALYRCHVKSISFRECAVAAVPKPEERERKPGRFLSSATTTPQKRRAPKLPRPKGSSRKSSSPGRSRCWPSAHEKKGKRKNEPA